MNDLSDDSIVLGLGIVLVRRGNVVVLDEEILYESCHESTPVEGRDRAFGLHNPHNDLHALNWTFATLLYATRCFFGRWEV